MRYVCTECIANAKRNYLTDEQNYTGLNESSHTPKFEWPDNTFNL